LEQALDALVTVERRRSRLFLSLLLKRYGRGRKLMAGLKERKKLKAVMAAVEAESPGHL